MKNWPWYGYLVLAVLIFALAFLFYFKPQGAKLKVLTAERVKVEQEVQNLKQKKRELDKIEADNLRLRSDLMIRVVQFYRKSGMTQASAARALGLTQPRLNALLKGRIDLFSLDALVNIASRAGLNVRLVVKKAA